MDYRYYNYFTEIEEYFVRRRGKHLLVSPLDWALIESWKQLEIPLHVVFRGIDSAFDNRKGQRESARINSIFYCQQAVTRCFEAYQQAMVGQAASDAGRDIPGPPERTLVGIDALQADLQPQGSVPWVYSMKRDGAVRDMSYWRLPETAADDPDEAIAIGKRAHAAAI